jgi:hypothetical protein
MTIEQAKLSVMDSRGYEVLDALSHGGLKSQTYSQSNTFLCVDGKTYWVKASAQQGLVAELIAGRLASRTGAGPIARVIRVPAEALPADGSANHLLGLVVGSEDERNTVNARDLQPMLGGGQFDPKLVDAAARALVVAFQTWLGVDDTQVLINLRTGQVRSIDHGACFANTTSATPRALNALAIPGVPDDLGRDPAAIEEATLRIESVTDQQLVDAVTRIPVGEPWRAPTERRLEIANWLAFRRSKIREVMAQWQ